MSAIDQVYALRIGEKFKLRGRIWTVSDYRGGEVGNGYVKIRVWNEKGKETLVIVRENDKIEETWTR